MSDIQTAPVDERIAALNDPFVVVPYINGMLRDATRDAVHGWGGYSTFHPLPANNPYAYAAAFHGWWSVPADLIVIEQDIVPATGMIREMAECAHEWCVRPYHVGARRYTTGLGMCKIAKVLRNRWPSAANNIVRDPTARKPLRDYVALNESVERHLTRLGCTQHVHYPVVAHLHYPEIADAG